MSTDRRALVVVLVALAVALPAAALRAMCVGRSCPRAQPAEATVPFCSLPPDARELLAAGFRDGRGPHVMAVPGRTPVRGATGLDAPAVPWPGVEAADAGRVPLVFAGNGTRTGAVVPAGTTLDAVAPTIAEAIGLNGPIPGFGPARPSPAWPTRRPALPSSSSRCGRGWEPRIFKRTTRRGRTSAV